MKASRPRWDQMEKPRLTLEALFEEYLAVCRTEGKTPATLRTYREKLGRFVRFMDGAPLEAFSLQAARAYIDHLQTAPMYAEHPQHATQARAMSPISVKGHAVVLKGFATWLEEEGYTPTNVLGRLKPPKAPRKVMRTLTDEEVGRLLNCMDPRTLNGSRNMAILLLFLDTGLRCSELIGLLSANLFLKDQSLKVMGKGQKERVIPFGDRTARALLRYLNLRLNPRDNPQVFLTLEGEPMTDNAIKLVFQRWSAAADVPRLHIHLLRHTFATNYLRVTGNPFKLQRLLGHETLEMTRRYVDMLQLEETVKDLTRSPVDRLSFRSRRF